MRFSELDGRRIGVWGAGREIGSLATQLARRLPAARIAVLALDEPPQEDVLARLGIADGRVAVGADAVEALAGCDVVVRSPGVSIYKPQLRGLRARGVPVTTATGLWLAEHGGAGVVGVTGTKGKSTTAALLAHLLRATGEPVRLAGNIGVPVLDLLDAPTGERVVLELSSYQIADLTRGPEVVVFTNLYKEHVDWHGSEAAYREDKLRLLALPGVRARVLNGRDEGLLAAGRADAGKRAALDPDAEASDAEAPDTEAPVLFGVPGGWDVDARGDVERDGRLVVAGSELPLRGAHNALNLCAALTALDVLGVAAPTLPDALASFRGLPHRLELLGEHDGVRWVDDSISTTPESALAALASFPEAEVVLIAGGQDRGQDYARLGSVLAERGAAVIGLPATGGRLVAAARAAGVPGQRALQAAEMAEAVAIARTLAMSGGIVLLSPAAPSYGVYRNFEERGAHFRGLVCGGGSGSS